MKTQLHELKPSYHLVYFYRISGRLLVTVDYLYVESFFLFPANFTQLNQACAAAARFVSTRLGYQVYYKIEHQVASNVARADATHLFECPDSILRRYKTTLIRE